MASRFVHLHTHSHYSLLQALPKIPEIVERAKKESMDAIALTDLGNLYGAIEFYKKCKEENIKPIFGVDAYVAVRSRHDKQAGVDNRRFNILLLAENNIGYKNLLKLVTQSHLEGYYYKPRIDKELLQKYHEGLICLSGTFGGEVSRALRNNDWEKAERVAREHLQIFGSGNYFFEITHHPEIEGHEEVQKKLVELGGKIGIPIVAAQDFYYLNPEDKRARDAMLAIQSSRDLADMQLGDVDTSFISEAQAREYFGNIPDAIENTGRIADRANVTLELGKWVFPDLPIEDGISYDQKLRGFAYGGLTKRGVGETDEVKERIEYELKIIRDKGYAPYFLVVSDLLRYARENHILTNIRGSVSGSLVTYLTGITNVNPLEYKIPFERFLNPERPSAPDIDMDFADNRRDEMLTYVKKTYGEDRVAQIGTFGTMMARGSVRDIARSLGHEYVVGDKIAKLIPMGSQGFPMTIDRAIEITPELAALYKEDTATKEIIDLAKKIEGCARHISIHAAGVVISPVPLTEFTPLQFDPKGGKIITQYDMYSVEDAVLLKFDFLGIRNLSILSDAVRLTKKFCDADIDIEHVPLDDQKTFKMLARGETMGLFQLNGSGMTRYLKELKPSTIHDINAMVALYRPGPMQFIPDYIARKHNPELIRYLDPALEKILKLTYGILVYQDDLLVMARELAGYSWLEIDKFRKAVGKKIPEEMQAQKDKFINGCIKTSGWSKKKAEQIWSWIEPFAAYGFNKAHSVSYGLVAYQTAYMKANFPTEYMTAVLTAESGDVEKIAEIIHECQRMKIPVLPPDINESFGDFTAIKGETAANDAIRFGLYTIKNLGQDIADAIIAEREKSGAFISYSNFLDRVKHKNLNKKSLEALVKSGAMDTLEERGSLLGNIEEALAYNRASLQHSASQESLFGLMGSDSSIPGLTLKNTPPISNEEKLAWEKELLGLYISGHPLEKYRERLEKSGTNIKQLREAGSPDTQVIIGGIIEEAREVVTKKGERMVFLKFADFTGTIEAVVFPRTFTEYKTMLAPDKCVAIKGRLSDRNDELSLITEAVKEL
ncbi:MAG: DNA polymerase III subunit alpha [Candidatus Lloydbacteria bacterium]|nr:DNA polymerase III subunit alpha [Candidatus Lloydbacteria bacterium]